MAGIIVFTDTSGFKVRVIGEDGGKAGLDINSECISRRGNKL